MNKLPPPVTFNGAHEMPYCTVSLADMRWNATGTWRYLRPTYIEQIPSCQANCPSAEPIERWLAHLESGKISDAWEILTAENPFPGIMGRVCFHPCEGGCNRKDVGGAVTINMLERYLADEFGYKTASVKPWKSSSGKKIAVVGSGPAGLSCAYFSARLGTSVTVFEKFPKPGGLFRYGIPEYRLPKAIVDNELKKLHDLGIKFECGKALSKDEIVSLAEKYDAVFVSIGAHVSRKVGAEGEDTKGVIKALEFLENIQLESEKVGEGLCPLPNRATTEGRPYLNTQTLKHSNTVVIGGGNSAVDAARTALRLGAKSVQIIYRRSRVEMPAFEDEIKDAELEGIKIELLAAPKKIISENGRVKSIECIKMKLGEPDKSGRRSPVPVSGSTFHVPADLVLTAIGEIVDEKLMPPKSSKIYYGGDVLEQPRTVVNAVGSGKYAAIEMDCAFTGKNFKEIFEKIRIPETNYVRMMEYLNPPTPPLPATTTSAGREKGGKGGFIPAKKQQVIKAERLNTYYFDRSEPVPYPKTPVNQRIALHPFAEVHIAPAKDSAKKQIERCMHCGHCTQCDNCFIYCPDVSILKIENGYNIDFDFCKGCGICVKECPRSAMEMENELIDV